MSIGEDDSSTLPTVSVYVDQLNVTHESLARRSAPASVGNAIWRLLALPYTMFCNRSHIRRMYILNDVLKPEKLTLVLGPPRSGKTTLLRSIAGKLHDSRHITSNAGSAIRYNGHTKKQAPFILSKIAAYVDQEDLHLAPLSVKETFQFVYDCISGRGNHDLLHVTHDRESIRQIVEAIGSKVDVVLKFLGLEGCKDTMVGNEMIKGISGGQKRRVTVGRCV